MEFRIIATRILTKLLQSPKNQKECRNLVGSRYYSFSENEPKYGGRPRQENYPSGYGGQNRQNAEYRRPGYGRPSYRDQGEYGRPSYRDQGEYGRPSYRDQRDYGRSSYQGRPQGRRNNHIDVPAIDWSAVELPNIKKNIYTESDIVRDRCSQEVAAFRKKYEISVQGKHNNLKPILNFAELQLPTHFQKAFDSLNFESPMPIQSEAWPILLSGLDLIGIGQTGSGKTLGFTLPAVLHGLSQPNSEGANVVVLAPTRELAQQIHSVFKSICSQMDIRVSCIYGGASKIRQSHELSEGPMVIVATPGRLMDLMSERICNLKSCTYFILDEADRMLDMGFEPQIKAIARQIRADRQTLMWSATWPREVQQLARSFTANPVQINIGAIDLNANKNIKQEVDCCSPGERFKRLLSTLETLDKNEKVLIFMETQRDTQGLSEALNRKGIYSEPLHGGMRQNMRDSVIKAFRSGSTKICVATDVASRGLDVPDIGLVVNFEIPSNIDSYIHRIGRTARAGKSGKSLTFFTQRNPDMARQLCQLLHKSGQNVPRELETSSSRTRTF